MPPRPGRPAAAVAPLNGRPSCPPRGLRAPGALTGSVLPGALAHKCTADSNANALDGALDALVAFLGKADEEYAQR